MDMAPRISYKDRAAKHRIPLHRLAVQAGLQERYLYRLEEKGDAKLSTIGQIAQGFTALGVPTSAVDLIVDDSPPGSEIAN